MAWLSNFDNLSNLSAWGWIYIFNFKLTVNPKFYKLMIGLIPLLSISLNRSASYCLYFLDFIYYWIYAQEWLILKGTY